MVVKQNVMIRQESQCAEVSELGASVALVQCDESSPRQWFTLGPCTENTSVNISSNGTCPERSSAEEEPNLCLIRNPFTELCFDVRGQSVHDGTPVIAWGCSGQWNQLFHVQDASFSSQGCRVVSVQPELIGKRRGFDETVRKCLTSDDEGLLVLSSCRDDYHQYFQYEVKYLGDDSGEEGVEEDHGGAPPPAVAQRIKNYPTIPSAIRAVLEEEAKDALVQDREL